MPSQRAQVKYLRQCLIAVESHIDLFGQTLDLEHVHRIRVETKKVRALLNMICRIKGDNKLIHLFEPLKIMYRNAGLIRSAHMNLRLIAKHNILIPELNESEGIQLEWQALRFKRDAKAYKARLSGFLRVARPHIVTIEDEEMIRYFRKRWKKIRKAMNNKPVGAELHETRKWIKRLMYMMSLMNMGVARQTGLDRNSLDELQETIGDWHDDHVVMELLQSYTAAERTVDSLQRSSAQKLKKIHRIAKDTKAT